jgi:hypothetical protein
MKRITLITALFVFTSFVIASAQHSMNIAMAGIKVKPMKASISNVEVSEMGNWKTISLTDLLSVNHIPQDAKIQGIEISFTRSTDADAIVYDDIVKLIVPSTEEGKDLVSINKAGTAPWSNSSQVVVLGGANDNWGLSLVSLEELKSKGLYLEYKADGVINFSIEDLNVIMHFEGGSKNVKAVTFR